MGKLILDFFYFFFMVHKIEYENNLWVCASDGLCSQVEDFLINMDVNSKDENGYTALHAASSYGHLKLVELLLEKYKANVNITDSDGDTPLHYSNDVETANILIKYGADPTIRNDQDKLAIELKWIENNLDLVNYLQEYTPDFVKYEQEEEGEGEMVFLEGQDFE